MKALIPLPVWSILLGFGFGAIVGSFLNVVIYRTPRGKSLNNPRHSFCPQCGHQLGVPDLFPLLSWLLSGRKCRYCGEPVAARYFWVELLNGLIWAGIWYQYLLGPVPDVGKAVAYALAASALVAIIFIDLELYLIPDQVNAFLLLVGIGYNLWLYTHDPVRATTWGIPSCIAGALTGTLILWGIALFGRLAFGKDAMGHGDIKMARGVGAVLFPAMASVSFGLAVFLGAVLGIAQVLLRPRKAVQPEDQDEDVFEMPESIGSLLKCGIGYILCLDVVGLAFPKFAVSFFGESPYDVPDDLETFEAERTMIPFGPYLALGAILAAVFETQLAQGIAAYLHAMQGGPAFFGNTF